MTTSSIVKGMVFKRMVEGEINKVEKAKIAVFSCPLDVTQTETKVGMSTYLFTTSLQLMSYDDSVCILNSS